MKKLFIPIVVIVGLVLVIGIAALILIVPKYNQFIDLDEDVNSQYAQIETQLERRNDLIPNIVSTVQGYADHESEIFEAVAEARTDIGNASNVDELSEANDNMTSALSRLIALQENYPDLKADTQFTGLRDELAGTENRIAVARQDYNGSVQEFNRNTRAFPGNLVAGVFGFDEKEYFEASEESREVPEVDFNTDQDDGIE